MSRNQRSVDVNREIEAAGYRRVERLDILPVQIFKVFAGQSGKYSLGSQAPSYRRVLQDR